MKKILLFLSFILILAYGCSDKGRTINDKPILLDLFYGMEFDEGNGVYVDSVLDTIPGLKHFEFEKKWYYTGGDDYNISWQSYLGLYIDSIIPHNIWQNLQPIINKDLVELISYDEAFDSICGNEIAEMVQTPLEYAKKWDDLMNKFTEIMRPVLPDTAYKEIIPFRVCGVIHKVFEDNDWVTYLVEFSVDNHGGNGCPSYADYITFSKNDGHRLSAEELFQQYDKSQLSYALIKEFNKEKEQKGYAPTGDRTLMDEMSGFALVNDGVLIYFQPYVAGCGAEGQYNIIINENELR